MGDLNDDNDYKRQSAFCDLLENGNGAVVGGDGL
jgi:hypothetical protein